MAQTKKKRRSKHRGNAAGGIEARGRTGRPPTSDEKKKAAREDAREKRLYTPPTWASAAKRAVLASALMFLFLAIVGKKDRFSAAIILAVVAFAIYVPAGYYMDMFLYRRRLAKRDAQK